MGFRKEGTYDVEILIENCGEYVLMRPDDGRVWMKPKPKVTANPYVAAIIIKIVEEKYQVLLVKRKLAPYKGKLACPGGYVKHG